MPTATTSLNASLGLTTLWIVLGFIGITILLIVLLLRSGHGYSVRDTEEHAENFAGGIKEGHGGLPAFLWVIYAVILIWTVIYFVTHWSEFAIIFSH